MRPAILVAFAAIATAAPAMADGPGKAFIGELALPYNTSVWEISGEGAAYLIGCISAVDCGTMAMTATVAPMNAFCDAEIVRNAVVVAFPWATATPVNMVPAGTLALWFGEAWIDGSNARAFLACADYGGLRYTFQMGDAAGPPADSDRYLVLNLLAGLTAPPLPDTVVDLGGLTLTADGDIWDVNANAAGDGIWSLTCRQPTCDEPTLVGVAANNVRLVGACGASLLPLPPQDLRVTTRELGPADGVALPFTLTTTHSMCAAATAPALEACVVYEGVRYTLTTGTIGGCGSFAGVPEATFIDLVGAISAP